MIATFVVEIVLAAYVLWRYKLQPLSRLAMLILVCLAVFQLAEFMICGGWGIDGLMWSRIGYVAITLLPPLGIHMAYMIARRRPDWYLYGAYLLAAAFVFFFAFATHSISGHACQGNYVIFQIAPGSGWFYAAYYYGLLLAGVWTCARWMKQVTKKRANALRWLAIGYLTFLLPIITVNIVAPETIHGIPSIMCGFAVLLAFILVFLVMPNVVKKAFRR